MQYVFHLISQVMQPVLRRSLRKLRRGLWEKKPKASWSWASHHYEFPRLNLAAGVRTARSSLAASTCDWSGPTCSRESRNECTQRITASTKCFCRVKTE